MITAAQLWYIANVYPESVTYDEAIGDYEKSITTSADRSYWEVAAVIVNKLAGGTNDKMGNKKSEAFPY